MDEASVISEARSRTTGPFQRVAVLVSGGLDSAILLGESLSTHREVYPVYVRNGCIWETDELSHLRRYVLALRRPSLRGLVVLELPLEDVLRDHWSMTGRDVPGAETPDGAVYIPGRNVFLLAKAMLWCHLHGVLALALATSRANPFPDATPGFFDSLAGTFQLATGTRVEVLRPYDGLTKAEIMKRGARLPLSRTFSCLQPNAGRHCGACNKCAERRAAFRAIGTTDLTVYAASQASAPPA